MHDLGWLYYRMGRHPKAVSVLSEALDGQRASLWAGHPKKARSALSLSRAMAAQGSFDSARSYNLEALELFQDTLGEGNPMAIESLQAMVELHHAWHQAEPDAGHDATAVEYQAQLDAIDIQADGALVP